MIDWILRKRRRIIIVGVLMAVIPVLGLALFVYVTLVDHLVLQSNEKRQVIVHAVTEMLASRLDNEIVLGQAYVIRPLLVSALPRGDRDEMLYHLKSLVETSHSLERAFIASPQGVLLQDYPTDLSVIGKDFSSRDWYQGVSRSWTSYVSEFYQRQASPRRFLFAIAVPIKTIDGQVVGILVMQPKADFIGSTINKLREASGAFYVVDRNGRLIYHSLHPGCTLEDMADLSEVPVMGKARRGLSGTEKGHNPETGIEVNAAYAPLIKYGWGVVTERSLAEILAPVDRLLQGLAIFAVFMIFIAILGAYRWADMFSTSQAATERLRKEEIFDKAHAELLTILNQQVGGIEELGRLLLARLAVLAHAVAALLYDYQEGRLVPCCALAVPVPPEADQQAKEALSQRQLVSLSEIPSETVLCLSTGVGAFVPREVIALPLVFKGDPMGVLELASLHGFSGDDRRLVEHIAPQLGIAINTIKNSLARQLLTEDLGRANDELQAMNAEFQSMNEELQAQQQEISQANQQLKEVSRAKSDFLANMSHELRTPLNSIIGFSEVLQDQMFGPLADKQQEYVGHILSSGQHLLALINDILDLAKVESGKIELELGCFQIKDLLETALTIVREKAMKHGITLGLDLAPEADCEIVADQRKLKQILYNLLSNAVKFTPDGGTVTVAAGKLMADVEAGECLEISVQDTGIGIRDEDIHHLFQAFSQLESPYDKKHEGTGLGLALTRRLVMLHGGVIRVESRIGEGSRFIFTLPVHAAPGQPQTAPVVEPVSVAAPANASVLLIEDDSLARAAMESVLAARGYRVAAASGGQEGINAALAEPPDLIILDLCMPDLSGFEVAERLRAAKLTLNVPIMVLTAMALSSSERERLRGLVWQIFEKGNLSSQDFAELVANTLASTAR